jgi:hypothetical protein
MRTFALLAFMHTFLPTLSFYCFEVLGERYDL